VALRPAGTAACSAVSRTERTWYYGTPMGWGGFSMMALTMLVFWGDLIALTVVLLRRPARTSSATRIL